MSSKVLLTKKIKRWIETVLKTETLPEDLHKQLTNSIATTDKAPKWILFSLVRKLHNILKKKDGMMHDVINRYLFKKKLYKCFRLNFCFISCFNNKIYISAFF